MALIMSDKWPSRKPFATQRRKSHPLLIDRNMKNHLLLIISIMFVTYNSGYAQVCGSIYSFDPGNQTIQQTISSASGINEARAKGKTCAIQTYELAVTWEEKRSKSRIYVNGLFHSTNNLESQDFIWIIFRINGRVAKSVLQKGVAGQTVYRISDSLDIPRGSKVTMRAAMVVNETSEEIWLEKGYLEVCQQSDKAIDNKTTNSDYAEEMEPQMTITNVNEVVKLSWKSGVNPDANCFRVDRVNEAGVWEVVGFVKEACKNNVPCEHVFIDSKPNREIIGYRIYRVNNKGKIFMLAEEARPVN